MKIEWLVVLAISVATLLSPWLIGRTVCAEEALAAYWEFDEGSGIVANDSTGNGHDGNLTQGLVWVDGRYGSALGFDGVDDYVAIPALFPPGLSGLTVTAWVKSPLIKTALIVYHGENNEFYLANGQQAWPFADPQAITFGVHLRDGYWYSVASSEVENGTWLHLAGVWNKGNSIQIYVNATLAGNVAVPDEYLADPAYYGSIGTYNRGIDFINRFFNGTIDDVKVYNYALTAEEISDDYIRNDVAIEGITTSKTGCLPKETLGEGKPIDINVTVTNQGDAAESVILRVWANSTLISSVPIVDLLPGQTMTVSLSDALIGGPRGTIWLMANCSIVLGEAFHAEDNTWNYGAILLTLVGDVDGDRAVDIFDIVRMAGAYGAERGQLKYDPNSDLDNNSAINIFDIVAAAGHYGDSW